MSTGDMTVTIEIPSGAIAMQIVAPFYARIYFEMPSRTHPSDMDAAMLRSVAKAFLSAARHLETCRANRLDGIKALTPNAQVKRP